MSGEESGVWGVLEVNAKPPGFDERLALNTEQLIWNSDNHMFLVTNNNNNSDSTESEFWFNISIYSHHLRIKAKRLTERNSNKPEKELCLNTLFGVPGLPRLACPTIGLLLSLDIAPCCGEVKPSGSRQESTSSRDEQSASPEVSEDTLIRSQFTSWRRRGREIH